MREHCKACGKDRSTYADHIVPLKQGSPAMTLHGHNDVIQTIAVSPRGDIFATGSADGVVCIWNLACETWSQSFVPSP